MSEPKKVLKREECNPKYQWHITDLYENDACWEEDYKNLETRIPELAAYEGRLGESAEVFMEYMEKKQEIMKHKFSNLLQINGNQLIIQLIYQLFIDISTQTYESS